MLNFASMFPGILALSHIASCHPAVCILTHMLRNIAACIYNSNAKCFPASRITLIILKYFANLHILNFASVLPASWHPRTWHRIIRYFATW